MKDSDKNSLRSLSEDRKLHQTKSLTIDPNRQSIKTQEVSIDTMNDIAVGDNPIISQTDSVSTAAQAEQSAPEANDSDLAGWQKLLKDRGILEAALKAGWSGFEWNGHPGWAIPLADENGDLLNLPDGRPAQRWKNQTSTPEDGQPPKYFWGYPGAAKGQTKPEGCDCYHIPGVSLPEAIEQHGGALMVAAGEPDMLTLHTVGFDNALSFFGETNIPKDFVTRARRWGTTKIGYIPDRDDTGHKSVEKLATLLRGTGIPLRIFQLPEEVNGTPIKDVNDLYRALGCDPKRFRKELSKLERITLTNELDDPDTSGRKRGKRSRQTTAYRELPGDFYEAIESALGVSEYQSNGWSKPIACPFKSHEHDDSKPAAAYHRDYHIVHCLKCGQTWLAVEVGAVLGHNWRDYCKRERSESPTHSRRGSTLREAFDAAETQGETPTTPDDDDLGDQLIAEMDGNLAYFRGSWHRYENGWWQREQNVKRPIWKVLSDNKWAGIKPRQNRANSVESYLQSQLYVPDEAVDAGHNYINLQNGMVNLATGQLEPHNRELYATWQLDFAHDPDAQCPIWLQCLNDWLTHPDGKPDEEMICLLQEAFGYSLTTDTSFETGFWLYGPAASGKSTVLKVLQKLLGNGHTSLDLSMLDKNHYQLAELPGKRAITCPEARSNTVVADHIMKTLMSGERMVARQIYGRSFQLEPYAKLWWAMNELPSNRDRSDGLYRRLKILPFPNAIPLHKRDRKLLDKLRSELPGIFNWALEGLKRLRANGAFTEAAQAQQAVEAYRLENDVEKMFVDECCVVDPQASVRSSVLYDAYKLWCEENGYRAKTQKAVASDWARLGFEKKERREGNVYLGLRVK